jgi:hypothetical protein
MDGTRNNKFNYKRDPKKRFHAFSGLFLQIVFLSLTRISLQQIQIKTEKQEVISPAEGGEITKSIPPFF